MQNFMETILSAVKTWTKGKIKDSTADWNQNDPNADNYVKNRTHWAEYGKVFYLNEQSVNTDILYSIYGYGDWYYTFVNQKLDIRLEVGEKYIIVFDGIEYQETLREVEDGMCFGWEVPYYPYGPNVPYGIWISRSNEDKDNIRHFSADSPGTHTFAIYRYGDIVHKLDSKFLDLPTNIATTDYAMAKNNPEGTGSFSMNRDTYYNSGQYSRATGYNTAAIGDNSSADGFNTIAARRSQNVIGEFNISDRTYYYTVEPVEQCTVNLHVPNVNLGKSYELVDTQEVFSLIDTYYSSVSSIVDNFKNRPYINGDFTGYRTIYRITQVHSWTTNPYTITISGEKYSIVHDGAPVRGEYVHIVGNGTADDNRSNAHTLDWDGNAWFAGDIYIGGNSQKEGSRKVLTEGSTYITLYDSSTGAPYKIEIKDGNLVSSFNASIDDFTYTINDDGTRTITGWNETYLGEPSTEMIIPSDGVIL